MKPILYIFIIALAILSCKRNSKTNNQKALNHKTHHAVSARQNQLQPNDTAEIDPKTLGCLVTPFTHGYDPEQFAPGTFGKTTYVYNSIKASAKIIDTLAFNTSINILKEYTEFYLVCTPKAKSGYIKKSDLYLNKMFVSWDRSMYYYLVGITKYPPKADLEINSETCQNSALKIIRIDEKTSKILDVYTDTIMGAKYNIKSIYQLALKNTKAIFHISYSCMQDIETDEDLFIIDNGKNLSRLILEGSSGDGGYGDGSTVYLPITLNPKKIVLAKNGALTLDPTTAKPDILPYPENCEIPIEELVVVQTWSEEAVEDGKPEYNSDGTAVETVTITSTTYYRWNGNILKKIKIIKGK